LGAKLTKLNEFSIVRREEVGTIRDRQPILRFRFALAAPFGCHSPAEIGGRC
jgi:hypothetical protein